MSVSFVWLLPGGGTSRDVCGVDSDFIGDPGSAGVSFVIDTIRGRTGNLVVGADRMVLGRCCRFLVLSEKKRRFGRDGKQDRECDVRDGSGNILERIPA